MRTILRCTLAFLLAVMVWPVTAHAESGGYVGASAKAVKETYLRRGIGVKVGTGRYSETVGRRRVLAVTEHRGPGGWVYITVSLGPKPKPWKSGIATWYSIADNTPPGSRATSSGHPLGSYDGFTFASRHFPMGTQLLIKGRNGRERVCTMTDRGGLETIDLFKPASDYFGMGDKSSFRYVVVRRGW